MRKIWFCEVFCLIIVVNLLIFWVIWFIVSDVIFLIIRKYLFKIILKFFYRKKSFNCRMNYMLVFFCNYEKGLIEN